jgi:hypothetical protein
VSSFRIWSGDDAHRRSDVRNGAPWVRVETQHAARSRFRAGQVSLECVPLAVLPDNSVTGAYGT